METRSDEQIRTAVLSELGAAARPQGNTIRVEVRDGFVTLTGWVESLAKRWAAGEAAHRVRGVRSVVNEIAVPPLNSSQPRDADLAVTAICALASDALVPIEHLEVAVHDGWLTLLGEVDRHFHKLAAERVARRLAGLKGITNLITVRTPLALA